MIGVCLLVLGCNCAPAPNDAPTTKAAYSTKAPSAASTAKSAPAAPADATAKAPMVTLMNGTMKLQCTTKMTPGTNKTVTVCVNATTDNLHATTPAIKAADMAPKVVTMPALKVATLTAKAVTPDVAAVKTIAPPSKPMMIDGNGMSTKAAHWWVYTLTVRPDVLKLLVVVLIGFCFHSSDPARPHLTIYSCPYYKLRGFFSCDNLKRSDWYEPVFFKDFVTREAHRWYFVTPHIIFVFDMEGSNWCLWKCIVVNAYLAHLLSQICHNKYCRYKIKTYHMSYC